MENEILEESVTADEARRMLASLKGLQLVDVREPMEHRQARIPGARLIPLGELPGRLRELDRGKPLVFYCASGNRSGQALEFARESGYHHARHLEGGIKAWAQAGFEVER